MPEPLTIAAGGAGVLKVAGEAARSVVALSRAPEEVDGAANDVQACQDKVNELIKLRSKHINFLEKDPDHLRAVDSAIDNARAALREAKPVVERNTTRANRVGKISISRLIRPIQWSIKDRETYKLRWEAMRRTDCEVQVQITRLTTYQDVMVGIRNSRNEKEGDSHSEEEYLNAKRAQRVKGLAALGPVIHEAEVTPTP
ncbi:hypothetical protein QC763_0019600 [Podospora pseudopauciseta]|uniref:Uncharacterized protein n=2 Tax=Podospora TaxID=5144 RepID=A0ABR0I0T9_9PEZI|nr:hypothetical protein QC763_0019600 [Podospora pseudopauciseta]KAK4682479.1 hypothetical protein QC764_0019570 [Podospora pseudoanserina]